ncbi:MAG: long-chain fatty acid--CoA ligase [Hyphomicrobium sp.]|jgi:long-chain acyl-CoA synthetase|nr:long-chain fatty acid--CoA ligase [Hyphomicrobium sp.]
MTDLASNTTTEARPSYPWLRQYPPNVSWSAPFRDGPVHNLLDEAATVHPRRPCTNFFGRLTSYADIASRVDEAAAALQALGASKGVKIGLFLPNTPTFIIYYYAALKTGATVVNYNPLYTVEELAFQVKDSQTEIMVTLDLQMLFSKVDALLEAGVLPRAIVCSFAALLPTAKSTLFRLLKRKQIARTSASAASHKILLERDLIKRGARPRPVAINPEEDIAVLQYTGGTTGTPKGAMLTHANLSCNTRQVMLWAPDLGEGQERVMGVLPFFHVFAMTVVMNFGIAKAAEIVMVPRFTLDEGLALIAKVRPTIMPGVPTLFNAIQNHPKIKTYDLTSLKFCLSGGAPLPLEVKQKFEATTGCKLVEGYGLSEASPVVTCNPIEGAPPPGSIGLPLPGTIVSLRSLADPSVAVGPGERGELCVKGPQVMRGYWNKPEETANQFTGDFLRTGDVAIMDENGYFQIVDRIKDLIICSGYNVYPRRVEEAIYEHPAVEEVTVIGIPDAYRGEAPKAFIKLRSGHTATADDILRHLKVKLSKIELPAAIEFRDSLPKTMIGKLSKKELKAEEAQNRAT